MKERRNIRNQVILKHDFMVIFKNLEGDIFKRHHGYKAIMKIRCIDNVFYKL